MSKRARARLITNACLGVLRQDKELLWLPLAGMGAQLAVLVALLPFGILAYSIDSPVLQYPLIFVFYLAASFVTIFFNAAIILGVNQRLDGGDPTFRTAVDAAWEKRVAIFKWALFSAIVSTILKIIEDRLGGVGRLAFSLVLIPISIAWSLVSFLVLPTLVIEDIGIRDAIQRSTQLFKEAWGERLIAGFRIGLIFVGFYIAIVGVVIVGSIIGGPVLAIVLMPFAVIAFFAVTMVYQAVSATFQLILYRYATHKGTPEGWDDNWLSGAFAQKPKGVKGLFSN